MRVVRIADTLNLERFLFPICVKEIKRERE